MLSKRNTKTMAVVGGNGERPVARLVVLDGPGRGRKYAIKGDAVIGRSVVCDVLIDEEEVSRQHARIVATEEGFRIKDLGSQNGTTVNGMPITDAPIHIGDKIQLAGKVVLVLARYNPTEQEILERQRLETLGRLAAGLAHDFNNMQAVITAGLDFMFNLSESGALSHDRIQATLRDMMRASEQAAELARSLMTYARSDAAGFQAVDVSNLCNEVMHFVRRTFSRTVEIEAAVEPDLMAVANEPELHQLLMNLCINARDAMPEGGVLSITARPVTPAELGGMDSPNASRVVLIEVRDTGVGMDEETQSRIFEPFYTTKSGQGFGLGLATVKEIVSSHGGTMQIQSKIGQGSLFRIALPAAAPASARRAPSMPPPPPGIPRLPPGLRVLVADDHPMVLRTIERILLESGCEVHLAHDGDEVVERYRTMTPAPDLVLLDIDMPHTSGEEAIASLRATDPDARVLMVSGHLEEERERAACALGAVGFLHKPFSAVSLVAATLAALEGPVTTSGSRTTMGQTKKQPR